MKNKIILFVTAMLLAFNSNAQEFNSSPEMADTFRSNGKIYVVIAVLTIAFTCIIGYLIYIDFKLRKLENKK